MEAGGNCRKAEFSMNLDHPNLPWSSAPPRYPAISWASVCSVSSPCRCQEVRALVSDLRAGQSPHGDWMQAHKAGQGQGPRARSETF